jgi:hypothetical protein
MGAMHTHTWDLKLLMKIKHLQTIRIISSYRPKDLPFTPKFISLFNKHQPRSLSERATSPIQETRKLIARDSDLLPITLLPNYYDILLEDNQTDQTTICRRHFKSQTPRSHDNSLNNFLKLCIYIL